MVNLLDYKAEIFAIAAANGVPADIGRDMFVANVEKGAPIKGQPWYRGASRADYAALRVLWQGMTVKERAEALAAFAGAIR